MAKNTRLITPVGLAKYPHLDKPDNYKGQEKFKTKLILSDEDGQAFKKKLEAIAAEHKGVIETKKPKLGLVKLEDEDGYELTAKSSYRPAVFDSRNNKLPENSRIGGGSKLRLMVETFPYDGGLSLRLIQVQVIELCEYGSGGSSAFDEVEDGYEAAEGDDAEPAFEDTGDALSL